MAVLVLDASVVIAFFDRADAHHLAAKAALDATGENELVLPASAYSEALVVPWRRASADAADRALADLAIRVEPLSREIARRAAQLRSRQEALRLADAIVLATGDVLEAAAVLTADRRWPRFSKRARVI